jgi:hypothetical protein
MYTYFLWLKFSIIWLHKFLLLCTKRVSIASKNWRSGKQIHLDILLLSRKKKARPMRFVLEIFAWFYSVCIPFVEGIQFWNKKLRIIQKHVGASIHQVHFVPTLSGPLKRISLCPCYWQLCHTASLVSVLLGAMSYSLSCVCVPVTTFSASALPPPANGQVRAYLNLWVIKLLSIKKWIVCF